MAQSMASKSDRAVEAQDPHEERGLFGSLKKLLYVQPEEELVAAAHQATTKPEAPRDARPTAPSTTLQVPTAVAGLDAQLMDETRDKLWDAVDDAGPAFKQFLMSLRSLEEVIPDPTMRIKAALSMLQAQSVTPVAIKLDLGKVRGQLQTTISQAEQGYGQAMNELDTERIEIESTFRAEQERLQTRLKELNTEIAQIQGRLSVIPQEQQTATTDVAARTADINRNHQHVKAAHAAVVTEMDALATYLQ